MTTCSPTDSPGERTAAIGEDAGHQRTIDPIAARLRQGLAQPRLEGYIGVIYRPETERWSHYSAATLPEQYDTFAWFDETHAVTPLPTTVTAGEDETYPFGL